MDINAPLCAFHDGASWSYLTREKFQLITLGMLQCYPVISIAYPYYLDIYNKSQLDVLGHSYHIGGSVHLLSISIAPEIIIKLGSWTLLCFLLYWHHLELIIPLALTHAWETEQKAFAKKFNITNTGSDMSFNFVL